ncbi:MAG: cytidine/deoxycytidylate deaminase family protein [Candidatus Aenigmarchaeota archaeon]|nr:cytidine/deoxycytidylate deaminase family protein [Candidatus Aenigmarchaeota archaeon]
MGKYEGWKRPDWDTYWMKIVEDIGLRSTCTRHHFGCVIVKNNVIVSTGYNGPPSGLPHCDEIGCIREKLNIPSGTRMEVCDAVHAEQNAIIRGDPSKLKGATLYVNAKPCKMCARMIINAGIKRVVYIDDYPDKEGIELLKKAGIDTFVFDRKRLDELKDRLDKFK